jgi:predicted dehydrogenase
MFVSGRGTAGVGTVLPALYEAAGDGMIECVHIASTKAASSADVRKRAAALSKMMGIKMPVGASPVKGHDGAAYAKALQKTSYDCAIVVVPDHLHREVAGRVISRGVHALVVKPLTPTIKEVRQLIRLARQKKVYGAIEFHKRYDEANLKLRDVINEGKLGDLLYVSVGYSQRKTVPTKLFKAWVNRTNIFQYLGVHYVDLIYFAAKAKPVRVMATGQKYWLKRQGIDTYDAIQVFIDWKAPSGKTFTSSILTNWIDPDTSSAMSDQTISVVGTKGRFDSDQKNRGVQITTDEKGVEDFNPYFSQFYGDGSGHKKFQGYGEKSIRRFLEDVWFIKNKMGHPKDFEGIRPTFKDGLVSTAVIEAVNKSLRQHNQWVRCDIG